MPIPRNRQSPQGEAREGPLKSLAFVGLPTGWGLLEWSVHGLCLSSFGHPGMVFLLRPPGNSRALEKPKEVLRSTPRQFQKQSMNW